MEELQAVLAEYRNQLSSLQQHLKDNPDDEESQELHAELTEALVSTEAAYTACLDELGLDAAAAGAKGSESPGAAAAAVTAAAAAAAADERGIGSQQQQKQWQQNKRKGSPDPSSVFPANKRRFTMHPANLYAAGEPDFAALAAAHPALAQHLIYPGPAAGSSCSNAAAAGSSGSSARPAIDFTSWEATKDLTAALLKVDFGVTWGLPKGQLVPPVPNRANYIHWIADLLQLSSPAGSMGLVTGLDIGCGANLIYCLLGASVYGWRMVGVDVTDTSLTAAQQLVDANPHLHGLLEVRRSLCEAGADLTRVNSTQQQQQQQQQYGPLMGALAGRQELFHFCMCNPPFFQSLAEANQNPNTACGGTAAEMVCPGGELAFVRAMIADSFVLKERVHWYSSMCGKKASMKVLRQELHAAGVTAMRTTELVQGKTSRWAIAWSFTVPANMANLPLPRAHGPQQQQQQQQQQDAEQVVVKQQQQRQRPHQQQQHQQQQSFTVVAPIAEGRRVLQALGALFVSLCGAQQLQVDTSKWVITCKLPVGADSSTGQQQQQQDAGGVTIEVNVFQQRKAFQVVAKLSGAGPSSSGNSSSRVLTAATEKVRGDMALMWEVKDTTM